MPNHSLFWSQYNMEEEEDPLDALMDPTFYDHVKYGSIETVAKPMPYQSAAFITGAASTNVGVKVLRAGAYALNPNLGTALDAYGEDNLQSKLTELSRDAYERSHSMIADKLNPASDDFDPLYAAWSMASQEATITDKGYFDKQVIYKAITMGLPSLVLAYGGGALAAAVGGPIAGIATTATLTGLMEGGSEFAEAIKYNMDLGMSYEEAVNVASLSAGAYAIAAAILEGSMPAGRIFSKLPKAVKKSWLSTRLTAINTKVGRKYDDFGKTWYGKPLNNIVGQAAMESLEEFSQYAAQVGIQGFYKEESRGEIWDWEEAQMSAYGGLLLGGGMGSVQTGAQWSGLPERIQHKRAKPTLGQTDLLIKKDKETGFFNLEMWDKENKLVSKDPFNTFKEAKQVREKLIDGAEAARKFKKELEAAETLPSTETKADGAPVNSSDSSGLQRSTQELLMLSFMGREADLSPEELVQLEDYKTELITQGRTVPQQIEDLVKTSPQMLESMGIPVDEFMQQTEDQEMNVSPEIFEDQQDPVAPDQESEVTESDIPGFAGDILATSEDTEVTQTPTSLEEQEDAKQDDVEPTQQELPLEDTGDTPIPAATIKGTPPVSVTPKDVHTAAEAAGMKWDDDTDFMALSKRVTGKERIDDMTSIERAKLINAIKVPDKLGSAQDSYQQGNTEIKFWGSQGLEVEFSDVGTKRTGKLVSIGGRTSKIETDIDGKKITLTVKNYSIAPRGAKAGKKSVLAAQSKKEYVQKIRKVLGLPLDETDIPTEGAVSVQAVLESLKLKFGVDFETITDFQLELPANKRWAGRLRRRKDGTYIPVINLAYAKGSDAFHEYTHPIFTLLRKENPQVFKELVDEMMASKWGPKLFEVIRESYSEEYDTMDDFMEEALVTALGWFASNVYLQKISGPKDRAAFVKWVAKLFNVVKDYIDKMFKVSPLGFRSVSPHEMKHIKIFDIVEWLTNEAIDIDTTPIWNRTGFKLIDTKTGISSAHENAALSGPMSDLTLYGRTLFAKSKERELPDAIMISNIKKLIRFFKDKKLQTKGEKKPRGGQHKSFFITDVAKVKERMKLTGSKVLALVGLYPRTDFVKKAVEEMLSEDGPGVWYEFYDQLEALDYTYAIVEKMRAQDPNLSVDLKQKNLFTSKIQKGEIQLWEEFVNDMLQKGSVSTVELAAIVALNDKVSYDDSLKFIQEFQDPSNKKKSIKVGTLIDLYESWISTKFGIKHVEVSSVQSYSGQQHGMSGVAAGYGASRLGIQDVKTTRVHLMQDILWKATRIPAHNITGKDSYQFPIPGMGYVWYTFFEKDGYSLLSVENQSDLMPEISISLSQYKDALKAVKADGKAKTKEEVLDEILIHAAKRKAWFNLKYILGRAGIDETIISLMSEKPTEYWTDTIVAETIKLALHEVKATNESELNNMPTLDKDILIQGLIQDVLDSFSGTYNRSTRKYEYGVSVKHAELRQFVNNILGVIADIRSEKITLPPEGMVASSKSAFAFEIDQINKLNKGKGAMKKAGLKSLMATEIMLALNILQERGDLPHIIKVRLAREAYFAGMEVLLGGESDFGDDPFATGFNPNGFARFMSDFIHAFRVRGETGYFLHSKMSHPNKEFDFTTMELTYGQYFEGIRAQEHHDPDDEMFHTRMVSKYRTRGAYANAAARSVERWRGRTIAEKGKVLDQIDQRNNWIMALSAHEYDGSKFDLTRDFFFDIVKFVKDDVERMVKYYTNYVGPAIENTLKAVDPSDPFQDPDYLDLNRALIHFTKGQGAGTHWTKMVEHELQLAKAKGYTEIFFLGNALVKLMQNTGGMYKPEILYTTSSEVEILKFKKWIENIVGSNADLRDVLSPESVAVIENDFASGSTLHQADIQFRMDLRTFISNNPATLAKFVKMEENNEFYLMWKESNKEEKGFPSLGVKMAALKNLANKHGIVIEEVQAKDIPMLENVIESHRESYGYRVDLTTVPDAPLSRMSKLGINDVKETVVEGDQVLPNIPRPPITPDDPDWSKWFNTIDSNYKRISKFLNRTYLSMELRLWIDQVTDRLPSHLLPVFNKWMQQPHIANILDPDNEMPGFIGAARHNSDVKALNVAEIEDVFDSVSDDFMQMMEHETDEEVQVRKNSTFKIRKIAFQALGVTLTQDQMLDLIKSSQQHNEVVFLSQDVPRITHVTEPTEYQSRMMFRFWLAHNTQETVNQGKAGLQTRDNIIWIFDNGSHSIRLKTDIDPLYLPGESNGRPNTNDSNPSRERSHLISNLYKKVEGGLKASLLFLKNKGILGKSEKSLEQGWENTKIFSRYKKYSAEDIKALWAGELQTRKIVPLSVRGEQGQIIFARVTPDHEKLDPVKYWREQQANGYITKDQANVMATGTAFEKAANIARFEAINEIIPGFMVEEVDGIIQPASLLNIMKRIKIPFSPSVFNENMEPLNVIILDSKKIRFKFKGEPHKKGIIKLKGLPDKYIADGATFASRSTFRKFVDGLGLSPKSNKMKNFIYQKDGDKVLAYKHETFPVEPGMQFFNGTKLVAKVNDKGDIIDNNGNVIDMISTDNEAKLMNGYEYNTPIVLNGGSVGITAYADRPKQTSTFPIQLFNHVADEDIIRLVKNEMVNKEKGPLIRRIREAFRTTDSPVKMAAFGRKIDNSYPDGISSIVLEKLYLMSGVNPDNATYLDTMLQKRQVGPAIGMKVGNGYYTHIYPNLRQDLEANEVALAYDDVKNTIIKQYQDDTNDDNPSIEKVNKWLKDKDIRVLVTRSPITYIGGANYARVARLHTFSGLIEASSHMVFARQEGDHDGDAMQVEFLPETLDKPFKEYFDKIGKKVKPINIDEFRIDERRYDFSSLDDVFDLMAGITAGGRAIQELAAMQSVYGIMSQVFESITIGGIKIRPIPRDKLINLGHMKEGFKATPEDMLRIYVQAAVDVYNGLLLEKWGYDRSELFVSLFETEDGEPIPKGSRLYEMASVVLMEAVYPKFRTASQIKNGKEWSLRYKLSHIIQKSQEYLDFVNNRQAGMSIVLQDYPYAGAVVFKNGTALIEELATLPARVYTAGHERVYHDEGPATVNTTVAENIHVSVLKEWSETGYKAHLIEEAIEQSVLFGELPMYSDFNYNVELLKQEIEAKKYVRKMADAWYALMGKFDSGLTDTVDYNEPMLNFIDDHHIPFSELSQVGRVYATLEFLESGVGITTTTGKRPKAANSKPPYSITPGQPTMLDGNVMKEFNILWHKYLYEDDSPPFGSEELRSRERMTEKDRDFTTYTDNGTIMRRFCR